VATAEHLRAIREICDRHGILLIFDEILSGFRTGMSCAQGYYGVTPDVCLLGKALTNGVPLAAIAGRERIMMKIMDPEDPVVAGGTFSGNLLGCAAGLAVMKSMEAPGFFDAWQSRVANFVRAIRVVVADVPAHDSPQVRFPRHDDELLPESEVLERQIRPESRRGQDQGEQPQNGLDHGRKCRVPQPGKSMESIRCAFWRETPMPRCGPCNQAARTPCPPAALLLHAHVCNSACYLFSGGLGWVGVLALQLIY
jgi:hypothetical protein